MRERREKEKEQASGQERGQTAAAGAATTFLIQWIDIPRRGFSRQMRAYSL